MARKTLSADSGAMGTGFTDVTGLSFPVTAGKTYRFRFMVDFVVAASADGTLWGINGPAATRMNYSTKVPSSVSAEQISHGNTSYDNAGTTATPPTTSPSTLAGIAEVWGTITPSADGNIICRGKSENASGTLAKKGCSVEYHELI